MWGFCLDGRFLVALGRCAQQGRGPAAGAAGDAAGVKCLVAAVNVVGNGGDCGALPGLRHDDRVRGGYPPAVNRRVADRFPIAQV